MLMYGRGLPHSSVGKESDSNAGDPALIPGSGRSPEEGIGYPLHYSGASLVAQLVKNPLLCFLHWQVDYLPLSHLGSPQRLNRPVLLYISLTDHCEILSFCNRKCKKENILVLLSMKMQTSLRMWIHIKSLFVSL